MNKNTAPNDLLAYVAEIVAAFVSNHTVAADDLPGIIGGVYRSLAQASAPPAEVENQPLQPAVPIRKSVHPDYLICLEDGKKLKTLRRYLAGKFNMTPG